MNEDEGSNKQPVAGWVFRPGGSPTPSAQHPSPGQSQAASEPANEAHLAWSASEYTANPKNASWFTSLAGLSVLFTVVIYLLTKDFISSGAILMLGVIVGVFAARQPHELSYALDRSGVHMGPKFYPYRSFKSFSVIIDGAVSHVSLMSLQRFMPPLALHYSPENEDKIITTLADHLPYEEHKLDIVENFSRRVRF